MQVLDELIDRLRNYCEDVYILIDQLHCFDVYSPEEQQELIEEAEGYLS